MQAKEYKSLNMTQFALASLCPLLVMVAAMWFKPLWRDEYWSLFFADPSLGFQDLMASRLRDEVHPPFYYWILHLWQSVTETHFGARLLSIFMLIASAFGLKALTRPEERRAFYVFLLICAGSYWVIYFAAEIRPYIQLFCLATLSIFAYRRLYSAPKLSAKDSIIWIAIGGGLGLTHYFGALWFSCLSLTAGIAAFRSGNKMRFVFFGAGSLIGLLPVLAWLAYSFPHMDLSDERVVQPFLSKLEYASNQFFRGLLVKTFASNPVVTLIGFGALWAAMRGRAGLNSVIIWAAILLTAIAFVIHLSILPLIKERAFIVIMPAILFIFAGALNARLDHRFARLVPVAAVLMPLIFMGEYFKDREKIGPLRDYLAPYASACKDQPIALYYRPSTHPDFYPGISQDILEFKQGGAIFSPQLMDAKTLPSPPQSSCPVKAAAFFLRRGQDMYRADAIDKFNAAGLDISSLKEVPFGKGRNIIWVEND